MGRSAQTEPPVSVEFLKATFTVGANSGALIRTASARGDLVGERATYRDHDGVLRARFSYRGARRTMTAAKIGWIISAGAYPKGQVATIGDDADLRAENLNLLPHCAHQPWKLGGGQASSLQRKAEVDRSLLAAMAGHEGAGLAELAKLVGIAEGRISTKLSRLASRGLAQSPQCIPGRSWMLTGAGREIAMAGRPLLDDLDRDLLSTLAAAPMGLMRLSRRAGVCPQTIRRRARLLTGRGLAFADARGFLSLTPAGAGALGPDAAKPPPRWLRVEAISAASAKDVTGRTFIPEATAATRSNAGKLARAAAKRNRSTPFNGGGYFERGMAEAS